MSARIRVCLICLLGVLLGLTIWRVAGHHTKIAVPRATPAQHNRPPTDRPNILLISLDTVRPDHLGCYGYAKPTSPELDRFAATAVRFSQSRAQASWTTPSHMSLFTSRLPSSIGFDGWGLVLPAGVPTLAEVLRAAGYHTAGIVNTGGLHHDYGFARGYEQYEEYEPAKPEGGGDFISARAQRWLDSAPREPWFLFLHYFDAHDPYDSPEPLHSQFGALPREQATRLYHEHFNPSQPFSDPSELEHLVASYDAALAKLDRQVGKILSRVRDDTLVVVFSDHGEAFKEHGWLWHGCTLYDEEVRTVLLIRPPAGEGRPARPVVDDPVMLLDVAPTIWARCGVTPPRDTEGMDLAPLWSGAKAGPRPIAAETKVNRGGVMSRSLIVPPWKLIHDMFDGREQLYRLPDETSDRLATDPAAAAPLCTAMRQWMDQESFWLVTLSGDQELDVTLGVVNGHFATVIPVNVVGPDHDAFTLVGGPEHEQVQWKVRPGRRRVGIYVQTTPPDAPLEAMFQIDGRAEPGRVSVGRSGAHPASLPSEFWIGSPDRVPPPLHPRLSLGAEELDDPSMGHPFPPDQIGFYVRRFDNGRAHHVLPAASIVGREAIEQLRALGYMQ